MPDLIKDIDNYSNRVSAYLNENSNPSPFFDIDKIITNDQKELLYKNSTPGYLNSQSRSFYSLSNLEANNPDTSHYRKLFINHILTINNNLNYAVKYLGTDEERRNNPDTATCEVSKFLGKEGLKLYRQALQEEANSTEYRDAVFLASTSWFEGKQWAKKPVITISGPSGCGKSYIATEAIKKANKFLEKKENDNNSGNYVVAVDGAMAREVSQMRKLLIRAANNKGFSGLSDLDTQSSDILDPIKTYVQDAALAHEKIGVVIPDTFSRWTLVGDFGGYKKRIDLIDAMPNTLQIFCRIEGENNETFEQVVNFMGDSRAWKTDFSDSPCELDMNDTKGLKESKAYHGGIRFQAGVNGSARAEQYFIENTKIGNFFMKIPNDFILITQNTQGDWLPNDDSKVVNQTTRLISKKIFAAWNEKPENQSLEEYEKLPHKTLKIRCFRIIEKNDEFKSRLNSIITNSDTEEDRLSTGSSNKP